MKTKNTPATKLVKKSSKPQDQTWMNAIGEDSQYIDFDSAIHSVNEIDAECPDEAEADDTIHVYSSDYYYKCDLHAASIKGRLSGKIKALYVEYLRRNDPMTLSMSYNDFAQFAIDHHLVNE